jgi:tetratricopeptide (TPR) repeat protein
MTKRALCIGINYEGAAPGIPPLHFAEADARDMGTLLTSRGFTTTVLLGKDATRRGILAALTDLAAAQADLVILYLSGHGLHGNSLLDSGHVYYAPYDFDPDDTMVAVPMLDLAQAFEARFAAQNAFALLDCCYAGVVAGVAVDPNLAVKRGEEWRTAVKESKDITVRRPAETDAAATESLRALVAACPGNLPAYELPDLGHGAATFFALDGWGGSAADPATGQITEAGLYAYISRKLRERHMAPLAHAAAIGDIVLDQYKPAHIDTPAPVAPGGIAWPAETRLIGRATVKAAFDEGTYPGAVSMYDRPGQVAFWHIVGGQDVRRDLTDPLLAAVKAADKQPGMRFQLITSAEGNGKSTLLMRLEYELALAGVYVLVPATEGQVLDPLALADACRAAAADPARLNRRVVLCLDNVYRFNTPLLVALGTFPIPNLTILATARYTDVTAESPMPAPALALDPARPTRVSFDPIDLPNLNQREAAQLVAKIGQFGTVQNPHPDEAVRAAQEDGIPLLLAVISLTNVGGLREYVARRLVEINNGHDPAAEDPSHWEPFMRIYYAVALCRAWGVYTPQRLLPALTELPRAQVDTLLCTATGQTGMAREYLRGECGGTWRTDHQIIAREVLRVLGGVTPLRTYLPGLLGQLAGAPDDDVPLAAGLMGAILRRLAADPRLLLGAVDEQDPFSLMPLEMLDAVEAPAPSRARGLATLSAILDSPEVAPLLERLRQAATPTDLVNGWAPASLQLRRWEKAAESLTTALAAPDLTPADTAHARFLRGIAEARLAQWNAAEADFTQALALLPGDAAALRGRAGVFLATNRAEQALADYGQVLANHPDDPVTLNARGIALRRLARYDAAIADFSRALKLRSSDAGLLNNRGIVYARLRRFDAALADLDRAVAVRPGDIHTLANRAAIYRRMGRLPDALADLDQALAQQPDDPALLNARGALLRWMNRPADALVAYDRVLAVHPDDPATLYNRGTLRRAQGQLADALADLSRALELRPKDAATLNNRGTTLDNLGRPADALADYNAALDLRPDHPRTLYNRANALRHLGRLPDALADLNRALALRPDWAAALNNRGVTLDKLGRSADALADFTRSLELRPDWPATLYNHSAVLYRLGRYADALADSDRALALRPNDATVLNNRGAILDDMGRPADAILVYTQALGLAPNEPDTLHNRGLSYLRLNQLDLALSDFNRSLTLRPDHLETRLNRAIAYRLLNRAAESLADLDQLAQAHPADPLILAERAITLLVLARPADALAAVQQALAARPAYPLALATLARVQVAQADRAAAQATLAQLLAADPDSRPGLLADPVLGPLLA